MLLLEEPQSRNQDRAKIVTTSRRVELLLSDQQKTELRLENVTVIRSANR